MKITGRTSSITNAFINSIIPVVAPSENQVRQSLEILGMTPETFQCAYCGDKASEWDHLRPLVQNKKPTGYISEIHNLVPSCGKCNQSKGNKEWRIWILSNAKLSPKVRGIKDLNERIRRLEAYEKWTVPTRLDFEAMVGTEIWTRHWQNCERMHSLMRESQKIADEINNSIGKAYKLSIDSLLGFQSKQLDLK